MQTVADLSSLLSPGRDTWVKFCWVYAAGISEPLPHYSLFLVYFIIIIIIINPFLVTFKQMIILLSKSRKSATPF